MAGSADMADLSDPPRLGEYRLVREIGRGGMGVVYEAVQESLGRRVALKVLPPGLAVRGAFLERFRREARVAGRLHHTNIVPVHGSGEQDGSYFYAMQFIQGHGLDAVLDDVRRLRGLGAAAAAGATSVRGPANDRLPDGLSPGPAPTAETRLPATHGRDELVGPSGPAYYRGVARLGLQAAEALAYAHGQGVLHRDVKPSNLLIDHQGTLWVSDFGLAKAGGGDLTEVNDLVGTLRYMAPERFQGRVDGRSDVYALGATLYEMLTLRPAFEESDRLQLIARITQQAAPPPRQWAPDVPRDLETIVLKAMARDPADRYATAAALADDLRRFLDDRLILARRATVVERLRRWRRRSPATAALALSVAALLLLLAVGSTVAAVWLGRTWDDAVRANNALEGVNGRLASANDRLVEANDALNKLDAEKTEELWRSLYGRARAGRFSPRPGRRLDSLDALARAWRIRPDDALRTEAVACLALTDMRPAPGGGRHKGMPDFFDMDFDDALGRYACADRHGNVLVRRTADDAEIASVSSAFDAPSGVELSRDGRFVSVRPDGGGRLQVWDLDGAPDRPPVRRIDEQSGASCAAFSPDGRRVVVGYTDGRIVSYDSTTGRAEQTPIRGIVCRAAAVSADGRLAVAGEDPTHKDVIQVYDLGTGDRRAGWKTPSATDGLVWRPDGGLLAAVGVDRRVVTWDAALGGRTAVMDGTPGGGIRIAFSHDGNLLAGRDATGLVRLWDPRTGRQLFGTAADMPALRFSPDDTLLAGEVNGDGVRLWQVAAGRTYRTLAAEPVAAPPDFSGSAAIHPGGRLLAAAMSDGVRLWDLAGGGQCAFLPTGKTVAVAFDGDGNLLAGATGGGAAILRRPLSAGGADALEVGPPEKLPLHAVGAGLACARRGGLLAVATLAGAEVYDPDGPKEPAFSLQAHEDNRDDVRDLSVSPDGRWLATCSHSGRGVRVWDVTRRAVVREVPVEGTAGAVFSPDGRWLAAGGADDCQVFAVGSWRAVRRVVGAASAFSPDGAVLAVGVGSGVILLVDPQTGKQVARLEDPNQDRGEALFTPDGGRMAVVSRDGRCVHLWDLRLLRDGLARVGPGMEGGLPVVPPAPDPKKRLVVVVKN